MTDPTDENEIILQLDEVEDCPRCGGPSWLKARFAHEWTNGRGETVSGIREALLCPACDRGSQAADELIALFAIDDRLSASNLEAFGGLVAAWVESVRHQRVDEELLTEQHEQWRRGEL
ncbi:DUF6300 family protein [Streptomyces sp. NPDC056601]|uniref:DUF6300 family protein n=1 Tax=Streptomyces sp. NPDC056601 TaxID=3345875 RepID=UPI0036A71D8E